MTNEKLLRAKIDESGYKLKFISDKVGITYQALLNKISNKREFKAKEIQALCDLLDIGLDEKERIFFAENVD